MCGNDDVGDDVDDNVDDDVDEKEAPWRALRGKVTWPPDSHFLYDDDEYNDDDAEEEEEEDDDEDDEEEDPLETIEEKSYLATRQPLPVFSSPQSMSSTICHPR